MPKAVKAKKSAPAPKPRSDRSSYDRFDSKSGDPLIGPGVCGWCKTERDDLRLTVLLDRLCPKSQQEACNTRRLRRLTLDDIRPVSWYALIVSPGEEGYKEAIKECKQMRLTPEQILAHIRGEITIGYEGEVEEVFGEEEPEEEEEIFGDDEEEFFV